MTRAKRPRDQALRVQTPIVHRCTGCGSCIANGWETTYYGKIVHDRAECKRASRFGRSAQSIAAGALRPATRRP